MQGYVTEITRVVEEYAAWLATVADALASRRPAEGGWCVKEIIGHLIDSAANNHARFVQAQATDDLVFPGYDQEVWVSAQGYADADWLALVGLWRLYNLNLARVMAAVPDTVRMRPRTDHTLDQIAWRPVARTVTVTLDYLMADYVGHLKSHLHQITSLLGESTLGSVVLARFVRFLLRFLLFLVPLTALAILAFVGFSFVGAQLEDVPEPPKVALLRGASDQPLDLRPETLERSAMGIYLRLQTTALETPAGADSTLARFLIEPGETALTVASRLEEDGFISDASLFRNYMRYHGIDQRLAAGDFEIAKNMTMPEIAEQLQRARYEEVVLTIPEGMRAEEVADLLDVKGVMDGQAFLALVRGGSASVDALGRLSLAARGLAHAGRLSVPRHLPAASPRGAG